MSGDEKKITNFHKPCPNPACGKPVHRNSKQCSACGGPSPWPPKSVDDAPAISVAPYIVDEGFSCMVGESLRSFKEGEVIEEPELIKALLRDGVPIRERADADQTMICPHCHMTFLANKAAVPADYSPETKAKLERLGLA
jgi:hypothetical protein